MLRAEAVIDLNVIRHNVSILKVGTPSDVMAVAKADGYGHGLVSSARTALSSGATWLGTATLTEALALRQAGMTAPALARCGLLGRPRAPACHRSLCGCIGQQPG
ncbi:MAG: hypothetical protein BGO26_01130 [Actinobacteria bacterium 69-20]|jgi:alanine racemase|nr:alanine racemase [Actinomycetota bacterium]OJV23752.1 MAG: hypothetical protein BGO26_01130 [Actinobacteria bacterium 69-20]